MACRVSPDADLLDACVAQAALLDNRERVGKSARRIDIASDHQQAPHVGFDSQTRQQFL